MTAAINRPLTDAVTRLLDICFALAGLVAATPIFLVLIPLLYYTGEGAVFYRQTRIGRRGRPFGLLKFATMVKNAASISSGELTLPNDARVLPVGRVLRKTKLNELPQLINVLTGDISVIGPRPQTERYFNAFNPEQRAYISAVRPGLSGIGSVIFRDEEAIFARVPDPIAFDFEVIMPYKGEIECWFVAHRSVSLYFQLIAATVVVLLAPNGHFHRRLLMRLPKPTAALACLL